MLDEHFTIELFKNGLVLRQILSAVTYFDLQIIQVRHVGPMHFRRKGHGVVVRTAWQRLQN